VQPLALGFHGGDVVFATSRDVELGAARTRLTTLAEEAQAADLSPGGDRLAYRGASGNLHVVDLTTGKDSQIGLAGGLGDWSADGRRYAYPTDAGIAATDGVATSPLVSLAGVTGLDLTRGNLVAITQSSAYLANADGSGLHRLQNGAYEQPLWSPTGRSFAFRRSGIEFVAQVTELQGAQGTLAASTAAQDELVANFMAARIGLRRDQALSLLDPTAQALFGTLNDLLYPDSPTLARYYVLLSQPGREVVRLVLTQGPAQTAVDETLVLRPDANGNPLIHSVTETPRAAFASGPEVVKVTVNGGQVQVQFDSDLKANTVASAVSLKGAGTQATYDARSRTVTLTAPGGLPAGSPSYLEISSGLQDVGLRSAVPYELSLSASSGN
jgi:hypothetical protein